jgi:hypothetical protein
MEASIDDPEPKLGVRDREMLMQIKRGAAPRIGPFDPDHHRVPFARYDGTAIADGRRA